MQRGSCLSAMFFAVSHSGHHDCDHSPSAICVVFLFAVLFACVTNVDFRVQVVPESGSVRVDLMGVLHKLSHQQVTLAGSQRLR